MPVGPDNPSYLHDLYRAQILNDPGATERIARHGQQIMDLRPELDQ